MRRPCRALALWLLCVAPAVLLAACSSGLNPFKKEEQPLPGERISIATPQDEVKVDAAAKKPLALPEPRSAPDWTQPGGIPSNAPGHLQLGGGLASVWRADIGRGSSDEGRLTAKPVVYQNKIFTLDVQGVVSAFSTSGGGLIWRVGLAPKHEKGKEGFGGGMAVDDGRLYVATGFGTVVALNPANGEMIWNRKIGVPIRSSPTAASGKVYFLTTESRLYCLSGADGNELWTYRGIPESAILLSNVSPAVSGDRLVVPYPSGDVIAFDLNSGKPLWVESLSRRRVGSPLATLSDPARPVIDNGVVYAVGHAGRMVATALANGERLWTKSIRSTQTPWVAGGYVFIVDVNGKLLALARKEGQVRWVADLPSQTKWSGPVLAGGKLWLVSSGGLLVGVDAKTGQIATQRDLGEGFYIAPVVAAGRMYILSDKARLYALN